MNVPASPEETLQLPSTPHQQGHSHSHQAGPWDRGQAGTEGAGTGIAWPGGFSQGTRCRPRSWCQAKRRMSTLNSGAGRLSSGLHWARTQETVEVRSWEGPSLPKRSRKPGPQELEKTACLGLLSWSPTSPVLTRLLASHALRQLQALPATARPVGPGRPAPPRRRVLGAQDPSGRSLGAQPGGHEHRLIQAVGTLSGWGEAGITKPGSMAPATGKFSILCRDWKPMALRGLLC